ncbi:MULTISPECIES: FAD binding domain-containing protein [unclassified Amycolatopsis]|uniref:FAD binding domain-containing protein n=1 Tax=unclassified Amycolatopsis TaxID=2618356 RepID=UPI002E24FD1D|nr:MULTISPECIES: FAD binding domain-containing protein [unclassified Amycolatopsis]
MCPTRFSYEAPRDLGEALGLLRERRPTMAAAAPLIADPIVRNRGTLVGSLCYADPQGDWASVVLALDGSIVAAGPAGRRSIPARDFVLGPLSAARPSSAPTRPRPSWAVR